MYRIHNRTKRMKATLAHLLHFFFFLHKLINCFNFSLSIVEVFYANNKACISGDIFCICLHSCRTFSLFSCQYLDRRCFATPKIVVNCFQPALQIRKIHCQHTHTHTHIWTHTSNQPKHSLWISIAGEGECLTWSCFEKWSFMKLSDCIFFFKSINTQFPSIIPS